MAAAWKDVCLQPAEESTKMFFNQQTIQRNQGKWKTSYIWVHPRSEIDQNSSGWAVPVQPHAHSSYHPPPSLRSPSPSLKHALLLLLIIKCAGWFLQQLVKLSRSTADPLYLWVCRRKRCCWCISIARSPSLFISLGPAKLKSVALYLHEVCRFLVKSKRKAGKQKSLTLLSFRAD